jgi:hypothetical protein
VTQHPSVEQILTVLRRRQRAVSALNLALRGLVYGGLLVLAGVYGFTAVGASGSWWLLWAIPAAMTAGGLAGWLRPIEPLRLARALDRTAGSQDRFASAVQLQAHHRQQRVRLIVDDALSHVGRADPRHALPLDVPRELRWLPLMLSLFVGLGLLQFVRRTAADVVPEVSPEQWQELQTEFRRQIEREANDQKLADDDPLVAQLKSLADSLARRPDKKTALSEIARLRAELDERRNQLRSRNVNMRRAAQALGSSELQMLAQLLKQGDYGQAVTELQRLAADIRDGKLSLTAEQLEAMAADFERLAGELQPLDGLSQACQDCAAAAASFDSQRLSESLDKLGQQLRQNAGELCENDKLCRACSALDELEQRLAQLKSSSSPCSVCQGRNAEHCAACQGGRTAQQSFVQSKSGAGRGGLKAGRGTAENWLSGKLGDREIGRVPEVLPDREQGGPQTVVSQTLSADEKADSALAFREKFAEFVQQAEADLELEDIPLAYRDFLRRYFAGIKPDGGEEGDQVTR